MYRLSTFLLLTLLSFSLIACTNKTEEPNKPNSQSEELRVMTLTNEYTIKDAEISKSFDDIFEKVWRITKTNDVVIYFEDAPYEIEEDIIIQGGNRQFAYSFFEYHSDSYLSDAENVMYIVLSKDGEIRGYFILEGSELHQQIEDFIRLI